MTDTLTQSNEFVTDNIVVVIITIVILVTGYLLYKQQHSTNRRKKAAKASFVIGGAAVIYIILALIYVISAGSAFIIGRWLILGNEPSGTLQWFLVSWIGILIALQVFGFFEMIKD